MTLPVSRLTLYKHGLGFFERAGATETTFGLDLPRRAMDDVLKSLTVLPERGVVQNITFETPPDRNPNAQRQPLQIDANRPLSTVVASLIGHEVAVSVGDRIVSGELIGLEGEDEEHLEHALLSVLTSAGISLTPLKNVTNIAVVDPTAKGDLSFALEARRGDTDRAEARVTLSEATEVTVNYIAPAPSWRVSYRVLIGDAAESPTGDASKSSETRDVFIQGWGLFDNTLEEDLTDVRLTLTAGMPVSFRYELHQPNTPERPLVRDESRTVSAPIEFSRMESESLDYGMPAPAPAMAMMSAASGGSEGLRRARKSTPGSLAESAPTQAAAQERGTLFAYEITSPVSVRRGESGMVPILTVRTPGKRELLFNRYKQAAHPAASIRLSNGPLTLERGPATVLEDGNYAGEAVVPFSPGGAEVILAFSVELGVSVEVETSYREERRSLRILDGSLFIGIIEFTETTYHASSDLAKDCVLTIEHPRIGGTELVTQAVEQTVAEARFKVDVPARKKTSVTIVERRESGRYESISGLHGGQLASYLGEHLLDQETFKALSALIESYARVADLHRESEETENEREKVRARMDDTRKNLEPLDATHDSALRSRFITQLQALEDQMIVLDGKDQFRANEIVQIEQLIAAELQRLSKNS